MATSSSDYSSNFPREMGLKLSNVIFRVKNSRELIKFYVNNFGMENIKTNSPSLPYNVNVVGYPINYDENFNKASNTLPPPTFLEFHENESSTNSSTLVNSEGSKVYWKIGITLYDVDYAQKVLQSKQVVISDASQFLDIGYVCHLKDPIGYSIELLQHDFENTFKYKINKYGKQPSNNQFPLGYPACIGQITLHANNIDKTQRFYQNLLGMKLLSVQDVSQYDFTLYFFAWTNENPPKSDVNDATVNREWLWKRPYTTIEIRHFHHPGQVPIFKDLEQNQIGFEGIRITCNNLNTFINKMKMENVNFKESIGTYGNEIIIRDPDNIPIYISENNQ